jgi:hypothetical protein
MSARSRSQPNQWRSFRESTTSTRSESLEKAGSSCPARPKACRDDRRHSLPDRPAEQPRFIHIRWLGSSEMPASRSMNSGSSCNQTRAERGVATDAAQLTLCSIADGAAKILDSFRKSPRSPQNKEYKRGAAWSAAPRKFLNMLIRVEGGPLLRFLLSRLRGIVLVRRKERHFCFGRHSRFAVASFNRKCVAIILGPEVEGQIIG